MAKCMLKCWHVGLDVYNIETNAASVLSWSVMLFLSLMD